MIKITRGPMPLSVRAFVEATVSDGPNKITRAEQELRRAAAFFGDAANFANNVKLTRKTFTFAVYKDPDLLVALDAVFRSKCAYCESRFGHVMPGDIEHFRPKSEVAIDGGKLIPGYYWLAGTWENLLVSCIDCNRSRRHEVAGQPARVKLGKGTQFPLRRETARFRGPGPGVGAEEADRLLLDPCTDDPTLHLTYDENAFVHPRRDAMGQPSPMGATSITVLALQRRRLVDERLITLNQFRFYIAELQRDIADLNSVMSDPGNAALRQRRLESISGLLARLMDMLQPEAEFVGMLRDWLSSAKSAGSLADLEAFGIDLEAAS